VGFEILANPLWNQLCKLSTIFADISWDLNRALKLVMRIRGAISPYPLTFNDEEDIFN